MAVANKCTIWPVRRLSPKILWTNDLRGLHVFSIRNDIRNWTHSWDFSVDPYSSLNSLIVLHMLEKILNWATRNNEENTPYYCSWCSHHHFICAQYPYIPMGNAIYHRDKCHHAHDRNHLI